MDQQQKISKLYGMLESMEGSLGGGGGFEGFYGSVTGHGVTRVYESMEQHCQFDSSSFLVDVGGGVGRPLVHALVQPGLKNAVGLEVDEIKCMKSESVIRHALGVAKELSGCDSCTEPRVLHKDVEKVNQTGTLDPATHAYTFWEGIPARARTAFGELFAKSSTLRCIAIVQRAIRRQTPAEYMESLNFGSLQLMDTLSGIHMSGSNRSFTAYIFKRTSPPGPRYRGPADLLLDAQLYAPRLLQASLPRVLRSRRGQGSQKGPEVVPGKRGEKAAGRHIRVTLQDNTGPSHAAAAAETSSKRSQPKVTGAGRGPAGKTKGKVHASNETAAASAVELADVGRTLKPADLNVVSDSTAALPDALREPDADARGSRRQHREAAAQKQSSIDSRSEKQPQRRKGPTSRGLLKAVGDCTSTGDHSQGSGDENGAAKLLQHSGLGKCLLGPVESPASPGKRADDTHGQLCSPAKKLCSPSKA